MPRKVYSASEKEAREEYSRLRAIANKRIERLNRGGFENNFRKFPTLKELGDLTARDLNSLKSFVANPWTRSGVRREYYKKEDKKTSDALKAAGYDIPPDQIREFTKFMENWRRTEMAKGKRFRASDQTAQVFENAVKLGVPIKDVLKHAKAFLNHADELARMEIPKSGEGLSFAQVRAKWNYQRQKETSKSGKNSGATSKKRTTKKKK